MKDGIKKSLALLCIVTSHSTHTIERQNCMEQFPAAIRSKDYERVQLLIRKKADVNQSIGKYGTDFPLHDAIQWDSRDIVDLLLHHKANVQAKAYNRTALQCAAHIRRFTLITYLLHTYPGLFCSGGTWSDDVQHLLFTTAETKSDQSAALCQNLLHNKIDPNIYNGNNETPLHVAAKEKNTPVCELLLEAKADMASQTKGGDTPLHYAARSSNEFVPHIYNLLLKHNADVHTENADHVTPLEDFQISQSDHLCSVIRRNAEGEAATLVCVKELVTQGVVVNRPTDKKHQFPAQPLKEAVRQSLVDVMQWLLTEGNADPDIQAGGHAERPIASAVRRSENGVVMVQLLLDHKASVDAEDALGNRALLDAAYNGHADIVQLLLDRKANPHYRKPRTGETALWAAAYHNCHKIVKILLDLGVESDIVVSGSAISGKLSPLEYVTQQGYHESCELLRAAQAKCDEHKE